ncbi:MAG TPA: SAV_915 family protein [Trebonia sp.]|nr:SAV_915 family protein [Trebonia sp.]
MATEDPGQSLPELVIVPARPGADEPEMETRYTPDGLEVVLPAFSSVAKLVDMLGRHQPWICVPLSEARQAAMAGGLARVVIDPEGMA